MTHTINLPTAEGIVSAYTLKNPNALKISSNSFKSRIMYAAAHVVFNPLADIQERDANSIDWEGTLNFRRYLWSLGFKVAEVMDTAQRGMGLNWDLAKVLIEKSLAEAKKVNGGIACGAGTDHLSDDKTYQLEEIIAAYKEQCDYIESHDGEVILMASRALATAAKSPEDFLHVYKEVLSHVEKPVIIHWLGEMFDPKLKNYWGSSDLNKAMDVCLQMIEENVDKIDGIKLSLLDKQKEIDMRNRLPESVKMYTGDDFNYAELIAGDDENYSHALLGIFDPIAPIAAKAMTNLDNGDVDSFRELLEPTVPLSRHIFQTPTYNYKTGVVFLSYLNGHQNHFRMLNGAENHRSILHFVELFKLADEANVLINPELAIDRMKSILEVNGFPSQEKSLVT